MKKLILILFVMFLSGCQQSELNKEFGLNSMTTEEIIYELNFNSELNSKVSASIDGVSLTLKSETETLSFDVGNQFYLAVAPYKTFTHTWTFHSVTGCRAELTEEEMHVKVVSEDGEVIVDETIITLPNGFFELWLPRDMNAELVVTMGEYTATHPIGTFNDDLTCLATMELKKV